MEIQVIISEDRGMEGSNDMLDLYVNGEEKVHAENLSDCPEQANLAARLSFVRDIPSLMEEAYKAGKNNEELWIKHKYDEMEEGPIEEGYRKIY